MLLAIDVGNTTISLVLIREGKIHLSWSVLTADSARTLEKSLRTIFRKIKREKNLQGVVVCSVVPRVLAIVVPLAQKEFAVKVWVVGKDVLVPIKNRYCYPQQVGQDRLVGAYAAKILYGTPLIVIDFGTAITLDVVSKNGEYRGGIIVPGIRLTTEALFKKTALLPQVKIMRPKELIGRDTTNSILSGIFYGYGALCDGLIAQISRALKAKPHVVATGGYVDTMKQFAQKIELVDQSLIFKGLEMIYQSRPRR